MKRCVACGSSKPDESFYKGKKSCKPCYIVQMRNYRRARGDAYREWERAHWRANPKRRAEKFARTRVWRLNNPDKYRAQIAANNAIRAGRLVRPAMCSACGGGGPIDAHHDDYSQPLLVRWLCKKCHWHANNKGAA